MKSIQWESVFKDYSIEIKEYAESNTPAATPITSFAILKISGNDRYSFLQNQFTNKLTEKKICQLSAWCNPKGKVITNFIIINIGESYLLIFKKDLKDYLHKKLNQYIFRSEVFIDDVSSTFFLLGLSNTSKVKTEYFVIPENEGDIEFFNESYITRLPDSSGRYLIVGDIKIIKNISYELKNTVDFVGYSNWEKLDILSKVVWIDFNNKEKYLPQMINLDELNAISFKKGCYSGQEVVAKVHYLGKIKRTLKLVSSKHELYSENYVFAGNSEKKVGDIINSSTIPSGEDFFALAVIESDKLNDSLYADQDEKQKIYIIQ